VGRKLIVPIGSNIMSDKESPKKASGKSEQSAFKSKLSAARGQMNMENAEIANIVADIEPILFVAADLLCKSYKFDLCETTAQKLDVAPISKEVADGLDELVTMAIEVSRHVKDVRLVDLLAKGITIEGLLGGIFSNVVLNGEEEIRLYNQTHKDVHKISAIAVSDINLIRKEVVRLRMMKVLNEDIILANFEKAVVSFSNKVMNSLQATVLSAYGCTSVKAQEMVLSVINVKELNDAILAALASPVKAVARAKFTQ